MNKNRDIIHENLSEDDVFLILQSRALPCGNRVSGTIKVHVVAAAEIARLKGTTQFPSFKGKAFHVAGNGFARFARTINFFCGYRAPYFIGRRKPAN
ncbi:hypothetical protein GWI33_023410 [Rhynchophorus ferrugineus]|uniref:Uncharacterized protein n=1 Tax=Rhynchophorus ferrugineus TaxID=354439 RepID=A0A834IN25_RHYFE|nr:hypothetical protein GWI33_023410 [Rhynchophorus ferrugineus]